MQKTSDSTKITIKIPTHAYFASGIRDFTVKMIKNMTSFSEKWAYRFQAIVDELCNNAIEHGSEEGAEIIITFICQEKESITVIVEDSGKIDSKKSAAEMETYLREQKHKQLTIKNFSFRGRGLTQIVSSWTDSLEFFDRENGGLKIKITKSLDSDDI